MMIQLRRGRQGFLDTPAEYSQAPSQCGLRQSDPQCPFLQRQRNSLVGDQVNPAGIAGLLFQRRPPDITGFVVTVIVNAVNGMLWTRTQADIAQKSLKRITPSVTDTNAATTVPWKRFTGLAQTAVPQIDPCAMLRRSSDGVPFATRQRRLSGFATQAPARLCMSVGQIPDQHIRLSAAVAQADHDPFARASFDIRSQDRESAEALTDGDKNAHRHRHRQKYSRYGDVVAENVG